MLDNERHDCGIGHPANDDGGVFMLQQIVAHQVIEGEERLAHGEGSGGHKKW